MRCYMKKILALLTVSVLLLCIIFSASAEDSVHDPTYRFLYSNLLSALESPDSPDTGLLKAETATVWNSSNDLAGFLFEGQDWSIRGEADKKTGIITRILCRFPYISNGFMAAYAVLFTISGEEKAADFLKKYVPEDALLNGTPFPDYLNTLDAGNADTLIFEFIRTGPAELANPDNACDMNSLIRTMQAQD